MYSNSPSPISSPGSTRRQLNSGLNGYGRTVNQSRRRRPDAIDNTSLLATSVTGAIKVPSLTSEGGRLKRDLVADRDFKLVPQTLWNALYQWYGAGVCLPRQVRLDTYIGCVHWKLIYKIFIYYFKSDYSKRKKA